MREYGSPFYSYTSFFEYNFSWTIHHYEKGNTLASQFYTLANLPEIVRVKVKSLLLIVVYSTMIVGLPMVLGFCRRLVGGTGRDATTDCLVATICVVFVLATLKSIADVTQVAQLGRYYLPVFALALPAGVAGLIEWLDSAPSSATDRSRGCGRRIAPWSGPIPRGPTTHRGWSSAISFTGRACTRLASGSRLIPSRCRQRPGS